MHDCWYSVGMSPRPPAPLMEVQGYSTLNTLMQSSSYLYAFIFREFKIRKACRVLVIASRITEGKECRDEGRRR